MILTASGIDSFFTPGRVYFCQEAALPSFFLAVVFRAVFFLAVAFFALFFLFDVFPTDSSTGVSSGSIADTASNSSEVDSDASTGALLELPAELYVSEYIWMTV